MYLSGGMQGGKAGKKQHASDSISIYTIVNSTHILLVMAWIKKRMDM